MTTTFVFALNLVLIPVASASSAQSATSAAPAATVAQRTAGLERRDGYVPFYLDAARNRVMMEDQKLYYCMLYSVQVAKGSGNSDFVIDLVTFAASKCDNH